MKDLARFKVVPLLAAVLAIAPRTPAGQQPATQPAADGGFSATQLEQMVAPLALYPDSLLMQILMAATYPLEVVQADRWVKQNAKLKGKELDEALKGQDWDASVKSLCTFPEVLAKMSENLDWTQDLGDAFLGDQASLLDAVQRMRGMAADAGNLKTTKEQKVTVQEDKIIVIEPSDPEVIYVPSYSPTVVYGPAWTYPAPYYPPLYAPVPPGYGLFAFSAGVAMGAALWGNCNWGWGNSDCDIDIDNHNEFNRNTNRNPEKGNLQKKAGSGKGEWKHNPEHRKGANYKNKATAQKYGGAAGTNRVSRDQARGFDRGGSAQQRPAGGAAQRPAGGTAQQRPSGGARDAGRAAQPSAGRRDTGASNRAGSTARPSSGNRSSGSGSALSGSRQPSFDRASSSRGSSSRGSSGSRGGGSRGGGGRGGGGRGGGGGRR